MIYGAVRKRVKLRRMIREGGVILAKKQTRKKKSALPIGMSANAFLKAMKTQAKEMDPSMKKALNDLLKQTEDAVR